MKVAVVKPDYRPSQLLELGRIDTSGLIYDIEISGSYAYVADWTNGLVILRTNASGTDLIPPVLTIISPTNGTTVSTSTITVNGTATDDTGVTSLTVNGNLVTVESDGSLSTTVSLTCGINTIAVTATDAEAIALLK